MQLSSSLGNLSASVRRLLVREDLCPSKRRSTTPKQRSITTTRQSIIAKRPSITKQETTKRPPTTLIRRKGIFIMPRITLRKLPSRMSSITGTRAKLPVSSLRRSKKGRHSPVRGRAVSRRSHARHLRPSYGPIGAVSVREFWLSWSFTQYSYCSHRGFTSRLVLSAGSYFP
jgi:hypothetical protein